MLVEDRLGVESYHRWADRDALQTTDWNGRDLLVLEGNPRVREELSSYFHRAQFMQDGRSVFICEKEKSTTTQSAGGSAKGKVDSDGKSKAEAEAHYERKTTDEKGRSTSVKAEAKASVDQQGKKEAQGKVSVETTF